MDKLAFAPRLRLEEIALRRVFDTPVPTHYGKLSSWDPSCDYAKMTAQPQLRKSDGMRRPVSERDAVRSQVIDALEAQEIKETGNEEG